MPRIYLSAPDISPQDHASVDAVLTSNWVAPVGPHLAEFEKTVAESVGRSHALALNSGTAALHLALQVLGIRSGDAVVCPSLTFAASANPICYQGAEPIFIDSEIRTWNMDPALLEQALKAHDNIKAVIVVHLYGQCAEMQPILALCEQYRVPLIEDAAEALGTSYQGRPAGSFGNFSFFSFNGNKIITTSGGGMLLSNDADQIALAGKLATQAREPTRHYQHEMVGYNYRLSNVLAGLGLSQFKDLDRRIAVKRAHFEEYEAAFAQDAGITMMPIVDRESPNYWLSCLTVDPELCGCERDHIIDALEAADIEARPIWKPLHMQPVFASKRCYGGEVAEALFDKGICLPSGSGMAPEERKTVISTIKGCLSIAQQ